MIAIGYHLECHVYHWNSNKKGCMHATILKTFCMFALCDAKITMAMLMQRNILGFREIYCKFTTIIIDNLDELDYILTCAINA